MRLPSGCDKTLDQTDNPTEWFVDRYNPTTHCDPARITELNNYCGVADAEQHWGRFEDTWSQLIIFIPNILANKLQNRF